jgi:hypothetical protein
MKEMNTQLNKRKNNMSNECWNNLTITGDPEVLLKFRAENMDVPDEYGTQAKLSLCASAPYPEEVIEHIAEWGSHNWGTRGIYEISENSHEIPTEIYITFASHWAPPLAWMETVAPLYPSIHFKMTYEEEGLEIFGFALAHGDEFYDHDKVDEVLSLKNAIHISLHTSVLNGMDADAAEEVVVALMATEEYRTPFESAKDYYHFDLADLASDVEIDSEDGEECCYEDCPGF